MAKSEYGTCPVCGEYKYLNGRTCKTCTYCEGVCPVCKRTAKIYVDELCYLCYQDRQVMKEINKIKISFKPLNEYNDQLFQLYLDYIRRYRLFYAHIRITGKLVQLLQKGPIATINSWFDIFKLSELHSIYQAPKRRQGCVFVKIGRMLSELGIIAPSEEELDKQVQLSIDQFSTIEVSRFTQSLFKINTSPNTVLHYLRTLKLLENFSLNQFEIESLLLLNCFHLSQFFEKIEESKYSLQNRRKIYFHTKRFFSWAIINKLILMNPCPDIEPGKPSKKLVICSDNQLLNIKKYIRHRDTDPERAFLLSLIFFFGFSTLDLSQAQVIIQEDKLHIKMRRRKLTKGKRYYYRKELIELPQKPHWFLQLQKRFVHKWSEHYKKVKKTYPNTPLVLPYSNIANRYMNTDTVRSRVKLATIEATGHYIPIHVLRQTCGHIYSSKADASILSTMGWSNNFAFHYTWLPRTYYRPGANSSETEQGNPGEDPYKG